MFVCGPFRPEGRSKFTRGQFAGSKFYIFLVANWAPELIQVATTCNSRNKSKIIITPSDPHPQTLTHYSTKGLLLFYIRWQDLCQDRVIHSVQLAGAKPWKSRDPFVIQSFDNHYYDDEDNDGNDYDGGIGDFELMRKTCGTLLRLPMVKRKYDYDHVEEEVEDEKVKTWRGRQRWLLLAGLSLWCPVPGTNSIIENLHRKSPYLFFWDSTSKWFYNLD